MAHPLFCIGCCFLAFSLFFLDARGRGLESVVARAEGCSLISFFFLDGRVGDERLKKCLVFASIVPLH